MEENSKDQSGNKWNRDLENKQTNNNTMYFP